MAKIGRNYILAYAFLNKNGEGEVKTNTNEKDGRWRIARKQMYVIIKYLRYERK